MKMFADFDTSASGRGRGRHVVIRHFQIILFSLLKPVCVRFYRETQMSKAVLNRPIDDHILDQLLM